MFEQVLVAVDGSPRSSKTLPVAVDLAKRYGSTVTVVHCREFERYEGDEVDLGPPIPATKLVEETVQMFRDAGVDATGEVRKVRPGHTPEEIIGAAKRIPADLIVMGTRGMTEIKSLLLGGVATKVVHHATCPVLLVR
jgi:nucleotide-binding universal stress UspA family protein